MDNNLDSCKLVFSLANETYKDYKHQGEWDKAFCPDVDNASAMVNDSSHPSSNSECWNCGELDCNVMTCPKPKDAFRIVANQKLFYHQKQKDQEASKAIKDTPKVPKAIPFAWRFPNLTSTIKGAFMDVQTPTILQNQAGMRMKPLQVGLPHPNHLHLLMMITPSKTQDESQIFIMQLKIAILERVSGIQ